jgi:Undecaprenyl-phosphate glucose phosphotransferase
MLHDRISAQAREVEAEAESPVGADELFSTAHSGAADASPSSSTATAGSLLRVPLADPSRRNMTISWSMALDLWLAAEVVALGLMMASTLLVFRDWLDLHFNSFVIAATGWVTVYAAMAWYRRSAQSGRGGTDALDARLTDWLKATIVLVLLGFLLKASEDISRLWVVSAFLTGGMVITVIAVIARSAMFALAESGALGERVAIYGCGDGTDRLIRTIENRAGPAARINALFDQRGGRSPRTIDGRMINRDFDELLAQVKARQIDAVMLNLPWSAKSRIDELVRRLEQVNVDIVLAPTEIQMGSAATSLAYIGSVPTLSLYRRPMKGLQAIAKVVLDRVLAAIALIFLSPLLLAAAIAIKLDSPGPVLFRQKRCGMNNSPFDMYKFRSMYVHAEDKNADKLVTRGDNRITRVGAFLRRTSIDELPQLVNVLLGDMSLVGPRPHAYGAKAADRLYEEVVRRYPARHRVLPGITGLAQVRGYRGNTGNEIQIINRVHSDLEYIDRWSLGLDMSILIRTALTFLFHRDAY